VYAGLDWFVTDTLTLNGRVAAEEDEEGTTNRLEIGCRYRF